MWCELMIPRGALLSAGVGSRVHVCTCKCLCTRVCAATWQPSDTRLCRKFSFELQKLQLAVRAQVRDCSWLIDSSKQRKQLRQREAGARNEKISPPRAAV